MPSISIVTCWAGNTLDLIPDYARAVGDSEVITVDNASSDETAQALASCGGIYLRQLSNTGFAAGNNIGYARATGDIIIFLNSDVAPTGDWLHAVAADVKDGALYGPSLGQQLVAGRWLPYIEGWCIAATRGTWERLTALGGAYNRLTQPTPRGQKAVHALGLDVPPVSGPWDATAYPGPYWEDNDLCLRALQAGLNLIQTQWPIAHKGGRTAGPILNHAQSFAENERTFTERVIAAFGPPPAWSEIYARYMQHVHTQSDIQHHLPLLYSLAKGNIVELGTRTGVSTAAFLAGVEQRGGHVYSVDLEDCSALYAEHPQWTFVQGDSRSDDTISQIVNDIMRRDDIFSESIDVLFIDTEHVYEIAQTELAEWRPYVKPGGYILMHDPETFPGVRRAAQEFADAHGWDLTFVLPCNGMAVIRRSQG